MTVDTSSSSTTITTSTGSATTTTKNTTETTIPTSPMGSIATSSEPIDCPKVNEKTDMNTTTTTTTSSSTSTTCTTKKSLPGSPMSPSSPITSDNEQMIIENMTVRIQKRPTAPSNDVEVNGIMPTYETIQLSVLVLPNEPTLEDIRTALTQCELGEAKRDIFFPAWTKSLYVTNEGEEQIIETDEQLREMLEKEISKSGSVVLQLQECRNSRYSRRKRNNRRRDMNNIGLSSSAPIFIPPTMYMMSNNGAEQTNRVDHPVYFDRPLAYYPYNIGGEVTFLPPPFIVPFQMYSTNPQ